jgi:hypothetical protein
VARSLKRPTRAFAYRAGVRVQGTVLACDATAGSELIFLSHAWALETRDAHALPRARHGRRQILATDPTLALLGAPGERLRAHALVAGLGRPFVLGELRLELFPSGHAPGAASLLCDRGATRVVYAGVVGPGDAPAVRPADALCLDATFGARRFTFPPRAEAVAQVVGLVREALSRGQAPVVLVDPVREALGIAAALAEAGVPSRAARPVVQAAATFASAGLPAPAPQRFDGRLRPGEALLWPRRAHQAPRLARLEAPFTILAAGWAADPAQVAAAGAERGVALSDRAGFQDLLHYVAATGAREVALLRAPGDELARALEERGIETYPLGPPRQIGLFSGTSGPSAPSAHVVSGV